MPDKILLVTCTHCGWKQKTLAWKSGKNLCKRCNKTFTFKAREGNFLVTKKGVGKVITHQGLRFSNFKLIGSKERVVQRNIKGKLPSEEDLDFYTYSSKKKD